MMRKKDASEETDVFKAKLPVNEFSSEGLAIPTEVRETSKALQMD